MTQYLFIPTDLSNNNVVFNVNSNTSWDLAFTHLDTCNTTMVPLLKKKRYETLNGDFLISCCAYRMCLCVCARVYIFTVSMYLCTYKCTCVYVSVFTRYTSCIKGIPIAGIHRHTVHNSITRPCTSQIFKNDNR